MADNRNEQEKEPQPLEDGGHAAESSRQQFLARMKERMGAETDWEDEEARYGAYLEHDNQQQDRLGKYEESNGKLAEIFTKNPKFAAMMRDVLQGEDASVAFVRYFGKDALDAVGDEEKMKVITAANQEYLNRVGESEQLRKTQEENLGKSEEEMSSFQSEKGLNDEEFGKFVDAVYHVLEQGLEGLIKKDFLEIFWKGLNYDDDLKDAARVGRTQGLNEKIKLENRTKRGDEVPYLGDGTGGGQKGKAMRNRRSFYEGGPGYSVE